MSFPGKKSCSTCGTINCMAHGGTIRGVHPSSMEEFDVERPKNRSEKRMAGESQAGYHTRQMSDKKQDGFSGKKEKGQAVDEHHRVLGSMKAMPKPKLQGLAHGGEIHDEDMAEDMDSGDDEIQEALAEELHNAFESKDKKQILESMRALIMSCKG